jgi:NADP-dependent 3-hydroxy acid dehydrogenase YdfG
LLSSNPCFHARPAISPAEILQHFVAHVQQSSAPDWSAIANIFSNRVQFNAILGYGAANQEYLTKTSKLRMSDIEGRVAVVTGASSGIGAAIVRALSEAGASVVMTARRRTRLEELAASLPSASAILDADICAVDTPQKLLLLAQEKFGRVDILVNNAAIIAAGNIDTVDLEALGQMTRVNFDAVVRASYLFARAFKSQGSGAIVNVSSIGAYLISRRMGVYGALKHALEAFTSSLRIELAGTGVKVGTVAPGTTRTEIFDHTQASRAGSSLPPVTPLEPEDIAAAVLFMVEQPARANIARLAMFAATDAY